MESKKEQSGSNSSFGAVAAAFTVIGAAIGAVTYHFLKKEPMQHTSDSRPKKVFNNGGTCPICLSGMEDLSVLPCGHLYHDACLKGLKDSGADLKCPVCRSHFHL